MFRSARFKLTITYTVGIAVIMAAFSLLLYLTLQRALAGNLEVEGNAGAHFEQALLATELGRARLTLLLVNLVSWLLAALISYFVAGRTLRPIEAALDRQQRFTAHASHELRTPLTVIRGEIEVTLARCRPAAAYRETLERVNAEVEQLESIISDLLRLTRAYTPRRTDREVAAVLRPVSQPFATRAGARGVKLVLEAAPQLVAALDWTSIEHVLRNLLDNALRHTPEGGEIRLEAHAHRNILELSVFNSGTAIAREDLPHLFLPFYRGRDSDAEAGTGLGLALCEWIVRQQGGSIRAVNVPDGVRFVVRLPHAVKEI